MEDPGFQEGLRENFISDTDRDRLPSDFRITGNMLWTLFVLLLLAWMVCVLVFSVTGIAIHLLLLAAAIVLVSRLVGRSK